MPPDVAPHQAASMLHKRGSHACTACQGKLYVMGGWDSTDFLASVEVMDPRINAWQVHACIDNAPYRRLLCLAVCALRRLDTGFERCSIVDSVNHPRLLGL